MKIVRFLPRLTPSPRLRAVLSHPLLAISTAYLLVTLAVRPFGEYPVNDDWQYARLVKTLLDTGRFTVDVDIAATSVLQVYFAAALAKLFGFSHLLLRLLTMTLSVILLWTMDCILRRVGTRRLDRALAVGLVLFNPIFLHLSLSFMTEIYGYAVALLAVNLWLSYRPAPARSLGTPIASWWVCLSVALLVGASFWIRQFCVAVLPALWGSALLVRVAHRDWTGVLRSVPRLVISSAVFSLVVLSYFAWAKTTGNYRTAFSGQLDGLLHFDGQLWWLTGIELLAYLTAFTFPFLLLAKHRAFRPNLFCLLAIATIGLIIKGKQAQPLLTSFHHNLTFPYSANVFNNNLLGPLTLSLEYLTGWGIPRWSSRLSSGLEWLVLGASLGFSYLGSVRHGRQWRVLELRYFASLFGLVAVVLFVQAYQERVLDRYHLPWILAAVLFLASLRAGTVDSRHLGWRKVQSVLAGVAVLPMAAYTIAGAHDYFRWNDARWKLARKALETVEANNLDGGFEVNGALGLDYRLRQKPPKHCAGPCRCLSTIFGCSDDTYLISLLKLTDRDVVAKESPDYWMLSDMPLYLLKRRQ